MSVNYNLDSVGQTNENDFHETNRYRCLFRTVKVTEDFYQLSCGIERCKPGKLVDIKNRRGYHLHIVTNGKGTLNKNGVTTEVKSGQMFLLHPFENIAYQADKKNPWSYCWITIDGKKVEEWMQASGFNENCNVQPCNIDTREFLTIVQKMLEYPDSSLASDLMRTGYTIEFLALVMDSYNKKKKANRKYREFSQENHVESAITYIELNYASITVEDIAKAIGIHRSHLASIFKKQMGVSPQTYLLNYRMKEGCSLLRETQLPIQEIAEMVGYDNPLTFSKIFKKMIGVSPREYRNSPEKEIYFGDTQANLEGRDE